MFVPYGDRTRNTQRSAGSLNHRTNRVERSTVVLRVVDSIPIRHKYLYGLQVVVPGLAVCVCEFKCL